MASSKKPSSSSGTSTTATGVPLADLNYKEVQVMAMSLGLPGNLKLKTMLEVIEARRTGQEDVVEVILRQCRESRANSRQANQEQGQPRGQRRKRRTLTPQRLDVSMERYNPMQPVPWKQGFRDFRREQQQRHQQQFSLTPGIALNLTSLQESRNQQQQQQVGSQEAPLPPPPLPPTFSWVSLEEPQLQQQTYQQAPPPYVYPSEPCTSSPATVDSGFGSPSTPDVVEEDPLLLRTQLQTPQPPIFSSSSPYPAQSPSSSASLQYLYTIPNRPDCSSEVQTLAITSPTYSVTGGISSAIPVSGYQQRWDGACYQEPPPQGYNPYGARPLPEEPAYSQQPEEYVLPNTYYDNQGGYLSGEPSFLQYQPQVQRQGAQQQAGEVAQQDHERQGYCPVYGCPVALDLREVQQLPVDDATLVAWYEENREHVEASLRNVRVEAPSEATSAAQEPAKNPQEQCVAQVLEDHQQQIQETVTMSCPLSMCIWFGHSSTELWRHLCESHKEQTDNCTLCCKIVDVHYLRAHQQLEYIHSNGEDIFVLVLRCHGNLLYATLQYVMSKKENNIPMEYEGQITIHGMSRKLCTWRGNLKSYSVLMTKLWGDRDCLVVDMASIGACVGASLRVEVNVYPM